MKPYLQTPIQDCGEPLIPIPSDQVALIQPHPYVALGAPYGNKSPYFLRSGVVERLLQAQNLLQQQQPGWHIQVFDAYRPIAVQHFMVAHAYGELLQQKGLDDETLTDTERQSFLDEVYQFWAMPSTDPATPPPHSTGAALDVTLVDAEGHPMAMGSPIDELSPRSYPNYFAPGSSHRPVSDLTPPEECDRFHHNRQCLYAVMHQVGFQRHPNEWWHFSFGDQMWAWLASGHSAGKERRAIARYGGI